MFRMLKKVYSRLNNLLGRWYLRPILREEWKHRPPSKMNERPVEYAFALKCLSQINPAEVLDVGAGTGPWPQTMVKCGFRVTAIDEMSSYWKGKFFNRHYYVIYDDITNPKLDQMFDAVTCISVLEHIPDHLAAIKGIFKLLNPGGHLILTFPYNEERYVDNVYMLPEASYGKDASYVCQVFSRKEIDSWLRECPGSIIEQEYYQVFSGELWTFGERICPIREVSKDELHQLTCIHIRKS